MYALIFKQAPFDYEALLVIYDLSRYLQKAWSTGWRSGSQEVCRKKKRTFEISRLELYKYS